MVLKSSNCTEFDHKFILKIFINVKNVKKKPQPVSIA